MSQYCCLPADLIKGEHLHICNIQAEKNWIKCLYERICQKRKLDQVFYKKCKWANLIADQLTLSSWNSRFASFSLFGSWKIGMCFSKNWNNREQKIEFKIAHCTLSWRIFAYLHICIIFISLVVTVNKKWVLDTLVLKKNTAGKNCMTSFYERK